MGSEHDLEWELGNGVNSSGGSLKAEKVAWLFMVS